MASELDARQQPMQTSKRGIGQTLLGIALPLAAAIATWLTVLSVHPFLKVGSEFDIGMGAPTEQRLALLAEQDRVDRWNATIVFAIGGALLAAVLVLPAKACCALPIRLVSAIPMGAMAGAFSGFVGSMLFNMILTRDSFPDATMTGLAQATVFGVLGLLLGLLFGSYSRTLTKIVTAGVLGAILGAAGGLLFPIITGLVMPQQTITGLVQKSTAGLLWLGLPFVAIGWGVPTLANRPHPMQSDLQRAGVRKST